MHRSTLVSGLGCSLFATLLALAQVGRAATFDVTDTANDDELQTAITNANASADAENTITFTFTTMENTITLGDPLPPITPNSLILDGTNDDLTIDGDGNTILAVEENVEVIDIALTNGTISISADRILTLDAPTNKTSSVDIDGAGGLTKEGAGILFLTGDLDYTGDTTISAGTLALDQVLAGNVANEGTLQLDIAGVEDYTGVASGTGGLTKVGDGVLALSGLNTYTGATIVNAGTLTLAVVDDGGTNRFAIEGDVTIQANGNLAFDFDGTTETFGGDLDGAGLLTKSGTGRLVLSGTNSMTGIIALNAGTLEGTSRSIAGDVVISNTATLVFAQTSDGIYAGNISSPGTGASVVKDGLGNLRLTGDNSMFQGTLQVATGTLTGQAASLPNDIANDANVVFEQGTNASYAGVVTGTGTVQKTGGGTLTLPGAHTYTGRTTIAGGRLDIDGSLASPVTVNPGATLGGIGSIAGAVTVNGRVAPGKGVGTLMLGSSAEFSSGSRLEIDIDMLGNGDRLAIGGTLDIEGGARVVPKFNDLDDPVSDLVIVTNGGLRTGTFTVDDDLAFQTVSIAHGANDIQLSIGFGTLFDGAITPNQNAIATALNNAMGDVGTAPELADAIDSLLSSSLSTSQGARALDEIGPEALSQLNTARLALDQRLGGNVQQRVRGVFAGEAAPLFGSIQPTNTWVANLPAKPSLRRFDARSGRPGQRSRSRTVKPLGGGLRSFEPAAGKRGIGGWLDGFGGFGMLDGDSGTADADYTLAGATLGLDYRASRNVLIGIGGGWGFTDLDVDDRSADGEVHTFHGLAYAGYATPQFHLSLSGRYAFSQLETTRRIVFGTVGQTADGDFDGDAYGGRLEGGVNVAQLYGVTLQPIAHFDLSRISQDGYRETGSPAFNLNVGSESIDSQISSLGLRVLGAWPLPDETGSFEPELAARWEHQFGDDDRQITGTLLGDASATPIALRGADTPTDRAVVEVGWIVSSYTGVSATFGYTGAFSSDQMEHAGTLSVQYIW